MSNACALRLRRLIPLLALAACAGLSQLTSAADQGWKPAQNDLLPLIGFNTSTPSQASGSATQGPKRGPLARLIANPDQTAGTPPYALTDQNGTIQRYVEPVPGIDLAAHLGQIVVVRHDTGPTLLATQLELPRERLRPLIAEPNVGYAQSPYHMAYQGWQQLRPEGGIRPVQYVDNDDMSVQLLPDEMSAGGMSAAYGLGGQAPMMDGYANYPGAMMPGPMCGSECGPACGGTCGEQPYCDPMQCNPAMMQPFVGPMVAPYGGYPVCAPVAPQACAPAATNDRPQIGADVEFLFYRVHMTDQVVGKLAEKYEFSPRFTLDFRNIGPFDGRIRYWRYARDTNVSGGGDVRFEWSVLDLEAMHYFEGPRSELALAAGIRFADVQLEDPAGLGSGSDMIGLTMAADGLTRVIRMQNGYCGWVYGGRVSILGGDWNGDVGGAFLNVAYLDDNVLVTELYAGVEVARCCGRCTVRGRVLYDMQNWRSDALAQQAGIESITLLGPALQIGADF